MHLNRTFPPFGVRIEAGPIVLRPLTDDVLPEVVAVALGGVHHPEAMPFTTPWTDATDHELPTKFVQYHWGNRATWSRESWNLDLAVEYAGTIVGVQGHSTTDYLVTRTGETGSWLGIEHHGLGIGTRMRQALCAFVFDELDAAEITSCAFADNPASLAVSRKVGYRIDGSYRRARRDEVAENLRLVLTPKAFVRGDPIRVTGADAFREFTGLRRSSKDGGN